MSFGGVVAVWTIDQLGDFGRVERSVPASVCVGVALQALRADLTAAGLDCLKGEGHDCRGERVSLFFASGTCDACGGLGVAA